MGRRSLVSVTALNRLLSTSRAAKKRKENERIIKENNGLQKQLEPIYSLDNLDFNEQTRVAKISFQKTVSYRTIERYIQRNYEKYPIYSNWKTKKTFINKSIKLTNTALESLKSNSDELIREFAFEIITWLKNSDLIPSWFIKDCIEEEFKQKNLEQQKQIDFVKNDYDNLFLTSTNLIAQNNKVKTQINENNSKLQKKIDKITIKINKIKNHKKNLFISIITFSIYYFLGSNYRLNKFLKKEKKLSDLLLSNQSSIEKLEKQNKNSEQQIQNKRIELNNKIKEIHLILENNKKEREEKLKQVIPLTTEFKTELDCDFIPLKTIAGIEYKKIIGCYVIKNRINERYYVGQSKDVIKRIHQHFKGTCPNNIIFAKDYFSAEDKENLFEIKILPCSTKDELDKTEKELIEKYDAFLSGYNGTSGNS